MNSYKDYIKRFLSIAISLLLLVVLSPLFISLYFIILIKLGKPVIFCQYRPGKNEKIFKLIKFRTMTSEKDENNVLLPDSQRLTKFGNFLRKTSLDELPELFNILKGDMSFIGPRPLSIHYLPSYDQFSRKRSIVRPGLTGLAQIEGRNNASWKSRIENDVYYVENISFGLDLKIFFKTIFKVIKQSDVQIRKDGQDIKNYNVYKIVEEQVGGMNTKEIGSYFELEEFEEGKIEDSVLEYLVDRCKLDYSFSISGRSAIDLAIQNILLTKRIDKVYLPSYSCISMTQPFLDNDIKIEYYEVNICKDGFYIKVDFSKIKQNDIFFYMDYFGYNKIENSISDELSELATKGTVIIEDITHSLFSKDSCNSYNDYEVCSLRKWFPIPSGGILYSNSEKLQIKPSKIPQSIIEKKIDAMKKKSLYLNGEEIEKKEFLIENASFDNELIRLNYENSIDLFSINILQNISKSEFIFKRRNNALFLCENIPNDSKVKLIYKKFEEKEVPLFVPLLVESDNRDALRNRFIKEGIYLPVHWPERISGLDDINKYELSLICDQRYNIEDMEEIIKIIS